MLILILPKCLFFCSDEGVYVTLKNVDVHKFQLWRGFQIDADRSCSNFIQAKHGTVPKKRTELVGLGKF